MEPRRFPTLRRLARRLLASSSSDGKWLRDDVLQLAIAIPVAEPVASEVTRIQIDILRKYGRNPGLEAIPHVTLKMGFAANDLAPCAEYVMERAAGLSPFDISIRDFGFFDEGIMFLDVEPSPLLENLRRRVLSDLSGRFGVDAQPIEDGRFRFHVTLAYGLDPREFAELRETYGPQRFRHSFPAENLDLLCHTGRQWVTCGRARLAGLSENKAV